MLTRPGSRHVIKVGVSPYRDPWPLYAAWCFNHPGPFKPTVRSLRWYGQAESIFYVAMMERPYSPLSGYRQGAYEQLTPQEHRRMRPTHALASRVIVAFSGWYRMLEDRGIDYRRWHEAGTDKRMADRLAKRLLKADLPDLARFMRSLAAAFPSQMLDPQYHNWMFTDGGRLVFTDPFLRNSLVMPEVTLRLVKPRN